MPANDLSSTSALRALFAEEITAAGGTILDTFDDGVRLFVRSILPAIREVRADDALQAGVALRATSGRVWVHPYVFRQICRNGAIIAHALQSRHIDSADCETPAEATRAVREAVRACSDDEAFANVASDIRSSREKVADLTLNLLPVLSRLRPELGTQIFRMIVERFVDGEDGSRYGLMNAVTSVARDTPDSELRWRLEELGGGISIGHPPSDDPGCMVGEAAMVG